MFRFAENSRCRENEIPAFAGMEGLVELAASFSFGDRRIFAFAGMGVGGSAGMGVFFYSYLQAAAESEKKWNRAGGKVVELSVVLTMESETNDGTS